MRGRRIGVPATDCDCESPSRYARSCRQARGGRSDGSANEKTHSVPSPSLSYSSSPSSHAPPLLSRPTTRPRLATMPRSGYDPAGIKRHEIPRSPPQPYKTSCGRFVSMFTALAWLHHDQRLDDLALRRMVDPLFEGLPALKIAAEDVSPIASGASLADQRQLAGVLEQARSRREEFERMFRLVWAPKTGGIKLLKHLVCSTKAVPPGAVWS